MPPAIDPKLAARVDVRDVTPEIRVVTMIPNGFPVDANHAFSIMDRDVSYPNDPFGEFPEMAGDYADLAQPSTEELVNKNAQDLSLAEDLDDRSSL
jgi:hypothetical protein